MSPSYTVKIAHGLAVGSTEFTLVAATQIKYLTTSEEVTTLVLGHPKTVKAKTYETVATLRVGRSTVTSLREAPWAQDSVDDPIATVLDEHGRPIATGFWTSSTRDDLYLSNVTFYEPGDPGDAQVLGYVIDTATRFNGRAGMLSDNESAIFVEGVQELEMGLLRGRAAIVHLNDRHFICDIAEFDPGFDPASGTAVFAVVKEMYLP